MIIPGILEKDLVDIELKIRLVEDVAKRIQIDVADGDLVDGKTFLDLEKLNSLATNVPLEIHLMVRNPTEYLVRVNNAKRMISQVEADDVETFVMKARDAGCLPGLSINLGTPVEILDRYIDKIQFVQFMSIEPGGQGHPFNEAVLKKISQFKSSHPTMHIQIDGGVSLQNIEKVVETGVDDIVVGSAIFGSQDPVATFEELNQWQKQ